MKNQKLIFCVLLAIIVMVLAITPALAVEPVDESSQTAPVNNPPIIEQEAVDSDSSSSGIAERIGAPLIPLFVVLIGLGAVGGWYVRGKMEKRKARKTNDGGLYEDDYDYAHTNYREDATAPTAPRSGRRKPAPGHVENPYSAMQAAPPSGKAPRIDPHAQPLGTDDYGRPYYADTSGEPFFYDEKTGQPTYYE